MPQRRFSPASLEDAIVEHIQSCSMLVYPREIALAMGVSECTARNYLNALAQKSRICFRQYGRIRGYGRDESCLPQEVPAPSGKHTYRDDASMTARALEFIRQRTQGNGSGVTRAEVQAHVGAAKSTAGKIMGDLMAAGKIQRIGRDHNAACSYRAAADDLHAEERESVFQGYRADILAAVGHEGGYRALMAAILAAACMDAEDGKGEWREDARKWFATKKNEHPFSYHSICDTLEIDPDWFKAKIIAKRRKVKRESENAREGIS